ncbi:MAG: hypothetical protein HN337_00325, partial [Deltaproteobacteria bacterium]|nr:hypothetical protein [Deltaproteobacteria bacterium]
MSTTPAMITTATGRRAFMGTSIAALGLAAVPAFVRAFAPQTTSGIQTDQFTMNPQTADALGRFGRSISTIRAGLTAYQASHEDLFRQSMTIRWAEPAPLQESLDAVTKPERRDPIQHEEDVTLLADEYFSEGNLPVQKSSADMAATFTRLDTVGRGAVGRMKSSGLRDIREATTPAERQQLGDDEFATQHGFQWTSEERGVFGPVAFASGAAVTLSLISLLYPKLISSDTEARMDRRAFFRTGFGGAGAAVGLSRMGGDNSAEISARGRANIRGIIQHANRMSDTQLFRHFFGMTPQELSEGILIDMRSFANSLNRLTELNVGLALTTGRLELERMTVKRAREIVRERPSAYGFDYEFKSDALELLTATPKLVDLAHSTADLLTTEYRAISEFLNGEGVQALTPAMRALF